MKKSQPAQAAVRARAENVELTSIKVIHDATTPRVVTNPFAEVLRPSPLTRIVYAYNPETINSTYRHYRAMAVRGKGKYEPSNFSFRGLVILNGKSVSAETVDSISPADVDSAAFGPSTSAARVFPDSTAKFGVVQIWAKTRNF